MYMCDTHMSSTCVTHICPCVHDTHMTHICPAYHTRHASYRTLLCSRKLVVSTVGQSFDLFREDSESFVCRKQQQTTFQKGTHGTRPPFVGFMFMVK